MLTKEALAWACKRLEDFYNVQKQGDHRSMTEAVTTLRESYGMDDEVTNSYDEWVTEFYGEGYGETMLLGLLVGVIACEYERW